MPVYRGRRPPPLPPMPPPACQNGMAFPVTERPLKPPSVSVDLSAKPAAVPALRTPQARVLAALVPADATDPVFDWPLVTRPQLAVRAGCTAISGTITRALNGTRAKKVFGDRPKTGVWSLVGTVGGKEIWEGNSSGDPHAGLLELKCVEEVVLDIEGTKEVNYRATKLGVAAYQAWVRKNGKLPALKDASVCVNDRYKKTQTKDDE